MNTPINTLSLTTNDTVTNNMVKTSDAIDKLQIADSPNPHNALYSSEQVYQIEKAWFKQGHDSFALMQQASWQMACCIEQSYVQQNHAQQYTDSHDKSALVWVGAGNNGGDGWLVAHYLLRFGWQVQVVEVGKASTTDSTRAKAITLGTSDYECLVHAFNDEFVPKPARIYVDALFGIGLDRIPAGIYHQAIESFNNVVATSQTQAVAVDIPSGLMATTGEVFTHQGVGVAIQADMTLCLIAYKLGLFTKDGRAYSGDVKLLPLIPLPIDALPVAKRINSLNSIEQLPFYVQYPTAKHPIAQCLFTQHSTERKNSSYHKHSNGNKGSFGHVLIIGGNQTEQAQGMGGASILATQGAFAVGSGKVTVACHSHYHGALLSNMPNAMSIDLHNMDSVSTMIAQVNMVAIGMGLGRDDKANQLFTHYLTTTMQANKDLLIDADGLYHLARISTDLKQQLKAYAERHFVAFTPHSGEMARLLAMEVAQVESHRLKAIQQAQQQLAGNWLLKGAGSLIIENQQCLLCDAGNVGMATAGMGDVLSGVIAGLQAQKQAYSLTTGVLLHALSADTLVTQIGTTALQAQDMATAIKKSINFSS